MFLISKYAGGIYSAKLRQKNENSTFPLQNDNKQCSSVITI